VSGFIRGPLPSSAEQRRWWRDRRFSPNFDPNSSFVGSAVVRGSPAGRGQGTPSNPPRHVPQRTLGLDRIATVAELTRLRHLC
jgi:hypothetical protein